MLRVRIDPSSRWGRWFRPAASVLVLVLGLMFAFLEARSPDRDLFAVVALLAAASVGLMMLLAARKA